MSGEGSEKEAKKAKSMTIKPFSPLFLFLLVRQHWEAAGLSLSQSHFLFGFVAIIFLLALLQKYFLALLHKYFKSFDTSFCIVHRPNLCRVREELGSKTLQGWKRCTCICICNCICICVLIFVPVFVVKL